MISQENDAFAERWREWQARNAVINRKDTLRARIAGTVLLAGVFGWLGLQLLAPVY